MNKKLILLTMSLLTVTMLQAQNIIRPKVECPNGIYVNSYNGVLFYQRPDVSVTNRNMRLEAVFYYNSSSNKKNYGYGNGWSLGSELRFVNDSLGVIIEQGDGRQDLYTRYGNSFEAPAGVFSTLSMEGDGYLLTYKDGTKYYFTDTVAKKVTMVKDRYDNAITFTYQEGNLVTASDISGRSLYFSWSNDLLSGIRTSFDDHTWSYGYDENGNLTSVTDPMGYTVHYAYNKDNRIKTFTDAEGYSTHISYNTDGMAHRVKTDFTDRSIRYEIANHRTVFVDYVSGSHSRFGTYIWDDKGRLIEIKNASGDSSIKFEYDDDNNLIRREDGNGNAATFTYDENGNRLSETDALGFTKQYTYEPTYNKLTSYTDKMGNLYSFIYNENGDLLEINGPLNYSRVFTYDEYGLTLTSADANHNITSFTYDAYGNMISMTDPLGNSTTIQYSITGLPISIIKPDGGEISYIYDDLQQLTQTIDPLDHVIQMRYDNRGNMTSFTDANGNTTTISYDALGRETCVRDPLESDFRFYYNSFGSITKTIDGLGFTKQYLYDDSNKMTMMIDACNDTMYYNYDKAGNKTKHMLSDGRQYLYQYDAINRLVSISDHNGPICHYQYDANDNIIQYTDAMGNNTYYYYDARNRLTQVIDAMGFSEYYTYDNNGNLLSIIDKNGHATTYSYNANNKRMSSTDALNNTTIIAYDCDGNIASLTDANGNTTTCQYNQADLLTSITFPNGLTRHFGYDANGNRINQQYESGNHAVFSYDAMNQLIEINYDDNGITSSCYYTYDAVGNMISATNADATVLFTYDGKGRVLSESLNDNITMYNYQDKINTITYPSGRIIEKIYDDRLQLVQVKENNEVIASYEYNNNGFLTKQIYSNGNTTIFEYDDNMRLTNMMDSQGIVNYEFTYNSNGDLLTRKDLIRPSKSILYTYDEANRRINDKEGELDNNNTIIDPVQDSFYTLDPVGNCISAIINGETVQYQSNNLNAYIQIVKNDESRYYQYDNNGNLTDDGEHVYQFNSNNRIISVDNGDASSYKYDALNRLIQTSFVDNGALQVENYLYSANEVVETQKPSGNLISSYAYGHKDTGIVCSINNSNSKTYYQKDQNGSTTALTNSDCMVVETYSYNMNGVPTIYDGNGNELIKSDYNNTFMYKGQLLDYVSNNYIVETRMMSTVTGQYTTTDPDLYSSDIHLYTSKNFLSSYTGFSSENYDVSGSIPQFSQMSKMVYQGAGYNNIPNSTITTNTKRNRNTNSGGGLVKDIISYGLNYHDTQFSDGGVRPIGHKNWFLITHRESNDLVNNPRLNYIKKGYNIVSDGIELIGLAKRTKEVYKDMYNRNGNKQSSKENKVEFFSRVALPWMLSKAVPFGGSAVKESLEDMMDWAASDCYYRPTGMSDDVFDLVQDIYSPAYTQLWAKYDK